MSNNKKSLEKDDGLVKSLKLDFLPQYAGSQIEKATIYCGQNKILGLFSKPSKDDLRLFHGNHNCLCITDMDHITHAQVIELLHGWTNR